MITFYELREHTWKARDNVKSKYFIQMCPNEQVDFLRSRFPEFGDARMLSMTVVLLFRYFSNM